ncbi:hypothetical protein GCM10009117_08960 [Gangjinia marincola]|uniref:Uncharacterized protein n=1 Tax=Gangjinia marincola TaxID=578463 RepID=A0ABP3XR08_9FLAO
MGLLGDSFPQKIRQESTDRKLQTGNVLKVQLQIVETHEKYIVILQNVDSTSDTIGYLIINSEINQNVFKTEYLRQQHVEIKCTDHTFLHHDSYIDCANIKYESKEKIKELLLQEPFRHKGSVSNDCFKQINLTISTSTVLSKKIKETFGF